MNNEITGQKDPGYSAKSEFIKRMSATIPAFDMEFFTQVENSGVENGVPYVRMLNGDILFGSTNVDLTYYKNIFNDNLRLFEEIGIKGEAFSAAFDALISYHHENCGQAQYIRKSSLIPPNSVVLDVGVRAGHFVAKAARLAGSGGMVIGVDATDFSEKFFGLHVRANNLTNTRFVRAAVGDEDGKTVTFFHGSENETFSGLYEETFDREGKPVVKRNAHTGSSEVVVRTIDSILDDLNVSRCDLVILQINGAEVLALQGMMETLARFRPKLFITAFQGLPNETQPADAIMEILAPYNYRLLFREDTDMICVPW